MAQFIHVSCRLPHGITLSHPKDHSQRVTLKGMNAATIIGATHVTTPVPEDFWNAWYEANKDSFPALKNGAIFVSKNAADALAMGKEFKDRKTGLEALNPKEHGVKTVPKDGGDDGEAAAA